MGGGGGGPFRSGGGGRDIDGRGGAPADEISYEDAERAMNDATGHDAFYIARYQADLREAQSADETRVVQDAFVIRKIAGRTFLRMDPFLVDQSIGAETALVAVVFGSDAYFELVEKRPDLKPVFAAWRNVAVALTDKAAVVIVDQMPEDEAENDPETGEVPVLEEFTENWREQLELGESR
jgi:hypothetical protein